MKMIEGGWELALNFLKRSGGWDGHPQHCRRFYINGFNILLGPAVEGCWLMSDISWVSAFALTALARMTSLPSLCRLEAGGMGELEHGTDEAGHLIM